jgi:hypothetical protein
VNRYERATVTISEDAVLRAAGLKRVYRSTGADDPAESCFAVMIWGGGTPDFSEVADVPQTLTVWLYDERGLDAIDDMLPRVRDLMLALVGADGIQQVEFNGYSGDLYDDRWDKDARNATFTVH